LSAAPARFNPSNVFRNHFLKKRPHQALFHCMPNRVYAIFIASLGNIHLDGGAYEKARDCYQRAVAHFERLDFLNGIAVARLSLGNVLLKLNELDGAEFYLHSGYGLIEQLGLKNLMAGLFLTLERVCAARQNLRRNESTH
jgi:tetratricopeptide (TPR) repeat protein